MVEVEVKVHKSLSSRRPSEAQSSSSSVGVPDNFVAQSTPRPDTVFTLTSQLPESFDATSVTTTARHFPNEKRASIQTINERYKSLHRHLGEESALSQSTTASPNYSPAKPLRRSVSTGNKDGVRRYHMVRREFVEDGPQRTITMDTWRSSLVPHYEPNDAVSIRYATSKDYGDEFLDSTSMLRDSLKEQSTGSSMLRSVSTPTDVVGHHRRRSSAGNAGAQSDRDKSIQTDRSLASDCTTLPSQPSSVYLRSHQRSFSSSQESAGSNVSSAGLDTLHSILTSCEPSLAHLAPMLESLGILTDEHMLAVSRLSSARLRDVRNAALKAGITVVEWAILLDRVQSLQP
ncbi:hypothetical protein FISHEDRAFT_74400 [Fistulina hepatica ATCC 64428]|uniref:Uncharacterized protein n=1 Tax=Fistulina hepatica ATCC 64428 TaxID=1128425 RepID=A0A0D7ABD9_9AGAR|nr:hypothetical protein FISHEDRAFT_74400 [Fistulina hepatica ATCC 64428]